MRSTATGSNVLALLLGLAATPAQAADVVGVAFVHGTGAQTNATQDYWQPAIIDTVRQGLPNSSNYVVINCDFTQYMWKPEAAGCLANQLTSFIDSRGITQLVVITHSNGGNVVRWILSNPTYDSRYPKIIRTVRKVTALAPSSAGTPLADAVLNGNTFETSLGWLLGYKNDAVRQQQVASMATYNAQNLYGTAAVPPCPSRSVRWSAVMWNRRCGTATATAAATPPMSAWSSPRTGCRPAPMASWSAAARRPPAPPGSPTRRVPRARNRSATTRAAASASASARSCATT